MQQSGEYTIAGPFWNRSRAHRRTKLFDPICTTDDSGNKTFWGFSLLVLDWESFLDEIELNTLEEAGYTYEIWKISPATGEHVSSHTPVIRRS